MAGRTGVIALALLLAACGGSRPRTGDLTDQSPSVNVLATADPGSQPVEGEPSDAASAECPVGVWTARDRGRSLTLTFRTDHTGEDVPAAGRVRSFLWRQAGGGRVHLCYTAEGDQPRSEWQLDLDCAAQVIVYRGVNTPRPIDARG